MADIKKPLEGYDDTPFSWNASSWTEDSDNRQADRSASLDDVTTYIYQSLIDYQGKWSSTEISNWVIRMPYARYLRVEDPIVNVDTGEIYSINSIVDKRTNTIRLGGTNYPTAGQRLRLDSANCVNFTSAFPQEKTEPDVWRDTITYRVKRREPGTIDAHPFGARKEIKPRLRQSIPDPDYPDYHVDIYGQWFDNLIQFDCWATTNFAADTLIEWFEDFMFKYTWVFKKNGVQEMLYQGRYIDEIVTKWRNDISTRSVDYYFRTEKIVPIRTHDFTQIDIIAGLEDTVESPSETIRSEGSTSIFQSYLQQLMHSDLSDMPDTLGVNSDHDARYLQDAPSDSRVYGRKNGDWIEVSASGGGAESATTEYEIESLVDVGAISAQDIVPSGTSLTEFVELLLLTTFYPTYTNPSWSLGINISSSLESGITVSPTLTVTFNRGSINGDDVLGIWNPSVFQDYRAGAATSYNIDGEDMGFSNTKVLTDTTINDGNNTWSSTTYYSEGPQPLDSKGNDYDSPYPSGNISRSATVYGRRKCFYGYSNDATDSDDIRSLQSYLLNPSNGSSFSINIPIGATNIVFAYPGTLQDVTSVKYVEGLNAEVKDIFSQDVFEVEGANSYSPIDYKVYVYTPVEAFDQTATYMVTI